MKLILKFFFWLWHKDIARRLKDNPLGHFFWLARVEIVYKPLFKERGLEAVLDEHDEYIKRLEERLKKKQRPPNPEIEMDNDKPGIDLTRPLHFGLDPDRVWLPFDGYIMCPEGHRGRKLHAGDSISLLDLTCEVCGKKFYYFIGEQKAEAAHE